MLEANSQPFVSFEWINFSITSDWDICPTKILLLRFPFAYAIFPAIVHIG
ncbi:MAG: hypothetical protein ACTS44_01685 [Candidatus Hodgkinia cicadicola]